MSTQPLRTYVTRPITSATARKSLRRIALWLLGTFALIWMFGSRAITAGRLARVRSCPSPLLPKDAPEATTYRGGMVMPSSTGPARGRACRARCWCRPSVRRSSAGQPRRAQQPHEPAHPPKQLPDVSLHGLVKPVARLRAVDQNRADGTMRVLAGPVRRGESSVGPAHHEGPIDSGRPLGRRCAQQVAAKAERGCADTLASYSARRPSCGLTPRHDDGCYFSSVPGSPLMDS